MTPRKNTFRPAAFAAAALGMGAVLLPMQAVHAQKEAMKDGMMKGGMMKSGMAGMQPLPNSVLLFPPSVGGDETAAADLTPAQREVQEIVSEALLRYLGKGGVGVVAYNKRLPSIQRARNEGTIKNDLADNGPGDSASNALRLADLVGANEYISISVDNYKFDPKTRTATYTINAFRNASDGTPLGTSAQNAVGVAPEDVSPRFQQGSAAARAADTVAEQTVEALYPQSSALLNPPPKKENKSRLKKAKGIKAFLVPIAAGVVYLVSPK